ncbi:hypothetical protein ACFX14_038694 [Malus domestica]|uniref:flavonol 4'-sulfotransferase-like n=1 Tax=Malus domestica TaxID=3750 RepID=UPI0039766ED2
MLLQDHFKAGASSTSNIFLASFPKSGTTWHRALIFATINRTLHDVASPHHPLLTTGPHDCFPYLQLDAYLYNNNMHEHRDHDHHSRSLMSHDDRDHDGDGFWKASLEFPEKILFLKYEDLKKEPDVQVKRLAEFLGQPFSLEEESQGVVQQIIKLCGFENLSGLEERSSGDWKNFFTEDMAKRMDQITDDKLNGSVLTFYTDA